MALAQLLPPLLIAVPVAGACLLLATGKRLPRPVIDGFATAVAVAGVVLAALLAAATRGGRQVSWAGGWQSSPGRTVGIVLVADPASAGLAVLISVLAACALLFGWRYFEDLHAHYHALLLLFVAGLSGFVLTGDLFDMFVFFELMGAAAYALAAFKIEEPESVQGGLNFAVVNSLGGYLALTGIGLVYARTGQLGLAQLGDALRGHGQDALVLAAFVLIATGWLVKAAVAPFHFWLADAHAVAPSPVCVLFSGVMAPLGVYGLARVYWTAFHDVLPEGAVHRALLVLGVLTAVVGAVMCVLQRHIKRMLAYSTIAHIGLFLLGVAALEPDGLAGAGLYLAGHAGVKGALFLLAGTLLNRYHSVDELDLHGRARDRPVNGVLFVLGALALAGLPPFGTGLGKALVEEAGGQVWPIVLATVVSACTGGTALRVALRVWFGWGPQPPQERSRDTVSGRDEEPDERTPNRTPATVLAAIVLLLAGGLAVGTVPALAGAAGRGAAVFMSGTPAAEAGWTPEGLLLGFGSAVAAAVVAVLAIRGGPARRPSALMRPVVTGLHRLHSGHLGDYAAWLVFGCALLAGLLALG